MFLRIGRLLACLSLCAVIAVTVRAAGSAPAGSLIVKVDGRSVDFRHGQRPYRRGDTWMIAVAPVVRAAKCGLRIERDSGKVTVSNSMVELYGRVGSRYVIVDMRRTRLPMA